MVIETFIDTQDLANNQSLVIIDEKGRRWDVGDALNKSPSFPTGDKGQSSPRQKVIVERWVIRLGETPGELPPERDLRTILPHTYKDGSVFFDRCLHLRDYFLRGSLVSVGSKIGFLPNRRSSSIASLQALTQTKHRSVIRYPHRFLKVRTMLLKPLISALPALQSDLSLFVLPIVSIAIFVLMTQRLF